MGKEKAVHLRQTYGVGPRNVSEVRRGFVKGGREDGEIHPRKKVENGASTKIKSPPRKRTLAGSRQSKKDAEGNARSLLKEEIYEANGEG